MYSGGDEGMVAGRPEPVWDFAAARRRFQSSVEYFDGVPGWSGEETLLLNVGLFGVDTNLPGVFVRSELDRARDYFAWAAGTRAPLKALVFNRGRELAQRYRSLGEHLLAIAERGRCGYPAASIVMDVADPLPFFVLRREAPVGANPFFIIAHEQTATLSLPRIARGLFQFLPQRDRMVPKVTDEHYFMVEMAGTDLSLLVYRFLPGNRLLYVTSTKVPDEIVEQYFREEFCPEIRRLQKPPPPPPPRKRTPAGTRGVAA
ncbi:MAG: hypothetical protein HY465_00575 [Deltaproteobacteria bacterium]|nr:hypothetical protein [Deltaproteobacteria bacterium]